MAFLHPYSKVHPQRAWTMEETKIPAQRKWTVEETKIPHRPNSASRAPRAGPRRDFRGPVVVNPTFQRYSNLNNEPLHDEEIDMQLMDSPRASHGPHRVAIKRENINVVRERLDVQSIADSNSSETTPLLKQKLIVPVIAFVLFTSMASLLLTALILSGYLAPRDCSCSGIKDVTGTSERKSADGDERIGEVSENITTLDKRLIDKILHMEQRNQDREQKLREETNILHALIQELKSQIKEQTLFQENKTRNLSYRLESTYGDLESLKARVTFQTVALWNAQNSTEVELNKLKSVWATVNMTAEKTSNLTAKVDQEFKNVKRSINATNENLSKLTSSLRDLKLKIHSEMETVWLNLNESQKCCNNLTTFLKSFKENVTYRSLKLEARIESEEQDSNNTKNLTDQQFKKIQDLAALMNATRWEAKEASWQHFTALWSAGNLTTIEFRKLWTALNDSQLVLSEKLRKVQGNLTQQLNTTTVRLRSSDASLFASLVDMNTTIIEKITNVSKMAGPIGPRGFNGSQGPVGPPGSAGPPAPKGTEGFSKCQYKVNKETETPGGIFTTTPLNEPTGRRVMAVSCAANYDAESNLLSKVVQNVRLYSCKCRRISANHDPGAGKKRTCFLHYWECPLT